MLSPDGSEALRDAPLIWALFIGGLVIFVGILLLLWRSVTGPARPIRTGRWIIGGGVLFPVVVLAVLQVFNLRHMAALGAAAPADALVIGVSGKLWWWDLRYTDPATGTEVRVANELHLPAGRAARLGLSSNDVIHSIWVPALAGKVDLVPGRVQHLVMQAERAGEWRGPCAEFCGMAHTQMTLRVVAHEPAAFDAWLAAQALPAKEPSTAMLRQGRQAFSDNGCTGCHSVRGHNLQSLPGIIDGGPDLTHLASRTELAAGTLRNDAAGLRRWLTETQQLKPGSRMPSYRHLDAATLDALVAYLGSLE